MDFKKLNTFRTAARALNFSKASNSLGYVQSAVTNQIKLLEEELETPLFNRNGRGVRLTKAGEKLLEYTDQLLALRDEAKNAIRDTKATGGTLSIAGYETILTYRLPVLLDQFVKRYPDVKLQISPKSVRALKPGLLDGTIDLAFILEEEFTTQGLEWIKLQDEEVVVVASPDHPLAGCTGVRASDLADETLLLTEAGCNYRNRFERALIKAGAYNGSHLEFNSIETIKACARLGTSVAAISKVSVEQDLKAGSLVALDWVDDSLDVALLMAWSRNRWKSPAVERFLETASATYQAS